MSEAERSFAAAWWVVDDLVRFGLEHACVSPGSRSTPIALALQRHPHVRVHVHLDERSSAFFALGIAKATGRPVAVCTTSGTAAAELFPAVVEAFMSRTTLVLLTADRPPELRGTGANQTIHQPGMFGRYVLASVDAPVPGEVPDEEQWHEVVVEVTRAAMGPPPGPVHLNVPLREPLVPADDQVDLGTRAPAPGGTRPSEGPAPTEEDIDALVDDITRAEHGLLYVGGLRCPSRSVLEVGERLGWPAIAEPISGLRLPGTLRAGQFLLSNDGFIRTHLPDLVVQFGAAPTSRAAVALVAAARRLVIVDPDDVVADPHRRAERRYVANAGQLASEALRRLDPREHSAWLRGWTEADERARGVVDATIDAWEEPYEGRVARDLAASLLEGSALVVGSSMPVRDLDAYMLPRDGLRVLGNRGASGIDGFVSTALGVAASGFPTTALCGDLTLLHDAGSLLWSARRGYDCVFVVPNNDGGAIFSFLPQSDLPEFEELFATPHGLDLAAVCSAAGVGHVRVERANDLVPAVEAARRAGGVHVVEVPIDRDENVRRHAEVHGAVADALAGRLGS